MSVALVATLLGVAIPLTSSALDDIRAGTAARYMAGRIAGARLDAVQRSAAVALRFEPHEEDYVFAGYADGNRNGVRAIEIASGVDARVAPSERLADRFAGVRFGLAGGVPDLDGAREGADADGVRIGTARILTLGRDGTATSGTLYLRGRRAHYAVRVLGATARTRVFRYEPGTGAWVPR